MKIYFQTSEGDMFPFSSVIRVTYKPSGLDVTRVYFVNGCIDLNNKSDGNLFYEMYESWLDEYDLNS